MAPAASRHRVLVNHAPRVLALRASPPGVILCGMYVVTEADAAAIREAYEAGGTSLRRWSCVGAACRHGRFLRTSGDLASVQYVSRVGRPSERATAG
jgi:hypothetical protein